MSLAHLKNQIVFLLLRFDSSYILDNSHLAEVYFANISSYSVACLLNLLTLSFARQKCFILMEFSSSIISFMDCNFSVVSKNISPSHKSSMIFPLFQEFYSFVFTLRCMIYFGLILVKDVKSVSRPIFLCVDVQLFNHLCRKNYLFFFWLLYSLVSNQLTIYMSTYFRALYFVPLSNLSILSLLCLD